MVRLVCALAALAMNCSLIAEGMTDCERLLRLPESDFYSIVSAVGGFSITYDYDKRKSLFELLGTDRSAEIANVALALEVDQSSLRDFIRTGAHLQNSENGLQNSRGQVIPPETVIIGVVSAIEAGAPLEGVAKSLEVPLPDLVEYVLDYRWLGETKFVYQPKSPPPMVGAMYQEVLLPEILGYDVSYWFLRHYAAATSTSIEETIQELTQYQPRWEVVEAIGRYLVHLGKVDALTQGKNRGIWSDDLIIKTFAENYLNKGYWGRLGKIATSTHREMVKLYFDHAAGAGVREALYETTIDPTIELRPDGSTLAKIAKIAPSGGIADFASAIANKTWIEGFDPNVSLPVDMRFDALKMKNVFLSSHPADLTILQPWQREILSEMQSFLRGSANDERGKVQRLKLQYSDQDIPQVNDHFFLSFLKQVHEEILARQGEVARSAYRNGAEMDRGGSQTEGGSQASALEELRAMPGMEAVAEQVERMKSFLESQQARSQKGEIPLEVSLHTLFLGNPGTGKTTVARILGKLFQETGFLDQATTVPIVEVGARDLIGSTRGSSSDLVRKKLAEAKGGILLIDELYALNPGEDAFGREVADVLLKEMEDRRGEFVIIGTGYPDEMREFLQSNPGFNSRFPNEKRMEFPDYDDETLGLILHQMLESSGYSVEEVVANRVVAQISRRRGKGFGNARAVRNVLESAYINQAARLAEGEGAEQNDAELIESDFFPPQLSSSQALEKLEAMQGLESVKEAVYEMVRLLELEKPRADQGLRTDRPSLNALFLGNPGTGKTTVGKLIGSIAKDVGYLTDGGLEYYKADELMGTVVGEAQKLTQQAIEGARSKVLMIDEAYLLADSTYGKAVIDTLVGHISPEPNQDIILILAGYGEEMRKILDINPGLKRRLPNTFRFEDFDNEALEEILRQKISDKGYVASSDAIQAAVLELSAMRQEEFFGNAGEAENLIGQAIRRQSARLGRAEVKGLSKEALQELKAEDLVVPRSGSADDEVELIGLEEVKEFIEESSALFELARRDGGNPAEHFEPYHSFVGPRGTGKEMVARIWAGRLYSEHVLASDELLSVSGSELIAEFSGQTSPKTLAALKRGLGRTILLHRLESLSGNSQFHSEARSTLASFLEDYRGRVAVIFSGTEEEVQQFFASAPQIARLVDRQFQFPKMSAELAFKLISSLLEKQSLELTAPAQEVLRNFLIEEAEQSSWRSGDQVAIIARSITRKQAIRILKNGNDDRSEVTTEDVEKALQSTSSPMPEPAMKAEEKDGEEFDPADQVLSLNAEIHDAHAECDHDHDHDHDHSAEEVEMPELQVSAETQAILQVMEEISVERPETSQLFQDALATGEISAELLYAYADAQIDEFQIEAVIAEIRELMANNEKVEEAIKSKRKVRNYICLACGRSTCSFMPFVWYTEE